MLLRSKLSSLREYLTPINNESNFSLTGEVSPDEFAKAGDYLVYKFPTWQWGTCPEKLQKLFLPPDKQFLTTKRVPSYQRVASYLGTEAEAEEEDEDGWVRSEVVGNKSQVDALRQKTEQEQQDLDELMGETAEGDEDMDDDDFQDIEPADQQLRKYDLYITYLTSYRVPKLYLVGFNSNGIPLLPKQTLEDISEDYREKTATIENLPVTYNTTLISIHPCKHANVMKVLMRHAARRTLDDEPGVRVDQYLVIFLKFIASVTPGIEYDYTMDAL